MSNGSIHVVQLLNCLLQLGFYCISQVRFSLSSIFAIAAAVFFWNKMIYWRFRWLLKSIQSKMIVFCFPHDWDVKEPESYDFRLMNSRLLYEVFTMLLVIPIGVRGFCESDINIVFFNYMESWNTNPTKSFASLTCYSILCFLEIILEIWPRMQILVAICSEGLVF